MAMMDDVFYRLSDRLILVSPQSGGKFPFCNGFIFKGDNETILVDAGLDDALMRDTARRFRIDTLVISHSHPDHIHNWHMLSDRRLLVPAQMPDVVMQDLVSLGERYTGSRERGKHWADTIGRMLDIHPLREPDGRFGDGHVFDLGGVRVEAIHAPGHLDDHYCFFDLDSGALIVTDIDFSSFGPWYGNPECDITLFKQSIEKMMRLPYSRVCSSHSLPHEGDATHLFQKFLDGFKRHENRILDCLGQEGKTLEEIVAASPFYRNRFPDKVIQNAFEEQMAAKNLAVLMDEGRIARHGDRFVPVK